MFECGCTLKCIVKLFQHWVTLSNNFCYYPCQFKVIIFSTHELEGQRLEQAVRPKLDSTYISGLYVDEHEDGHFPVKLHVNTFQHILINSRVFVSSTTTSASKKCP